MRTILVRLMLAAAVMTALVAAEPGPAPGRTADEMSRAALRLLDSLDPSQRARCALPFDGPARVDWRFVPGDRAGVALGEMGERSRGAARDLLRAALSSAGVLKVEAIMDLDAVLRDAERAAGGTGASRDPLRYSVAVFGDPAGAGAWGWKIEGHHVSLNFTVRAGDVLSVTPSFLGANPARVAAGPHAGRRVLAAEEDLARALLRSFDEAQRRAAVIAERPPADILTLPGRPLDAAAPAGLDASGMEPAQREMLRRLVEEYARNLRPDLAAAQLERMLGADLGGVRFAWAGGLEPGEPHYYRIVGRTFVIEYDNTQDRANHVHTVWHDLERNFGGDALRDHYEHHHRPAHDR